MKVKPKTEDSGGGKSTLVTPLKPGEGEEVLYIIYAHVFMTYSQFIENLKHLALCFQDNKIKQPL